MNPRKCLSAIDCMEMEKNQLFLMSIKKGPVFRALNSQIKFVKLN